VDAIVEGSVMREGNRIRVHAQLIRALTDEHFWSETYDRDLGDALSLESEVAQSIAGKVEVTVTGEEHSRLTAARPISPAVYESYLKGRFALDKTKTKADIEQSRAYFEEAINRDPTFAPAYVGLASAYVELSMPFVGVPPQEVRPKIMSAVRRALELDPQSVKAHVLLAEMQHAQWQWAEAEAEYKRALDLHPNDAAAHEGLAHWCYLRGERRKLWLGRSAAANLTPL
jgi:tetratricopeptide (TPR) repeat protein